MNSYMRPDGSIYSATAPENPMDLGIPEIPGQGYAFNKETWQWEQTTFAKVQEIINEYERQLFVLREAESAANMLNNVTRIDAIKAEYGAVLKERDAKIQALLMQPKGA